MCLSTVASDLHLLKISATTQHLPAPRGAEVLHCCMDAKLPLIHDAIKGSHGKVTVALTPRSIVHASTSE